MNEKTRVGSRSPGEPGRGFCQDLSIHPELSVLTAQTTQFGPFFGSQAVFTPALVQVVLFDPVADGLGGGLELFGQRFGTTAGANEIDHLLAKGRRIGARDLGMSRSFQTQEVTCPLNRVNSSDSFVISLDVTQVVSAILYMSRNTEVKAI